MFSRRSQNFLIPTACLPSSAGLGPVRFPPKSGILETLGRIIIQKMRKKTGVNRNNRFGVARFRLGLGVGLRERFTSSTSKFAICSRTPNPKPLNPRKSWMLASGFGILSTLCPKPCATNHIPLPTEIYRILLDERVLESLGVWEELHDMAKSRKLYRAIPRNIPHGTFVFISYPTYTALPKAPVVICFCRFMCSRKACYQ